MANVYGLAGKGGYNITNLENHNEKFDATLIVPSMTADDTASLSRCALRHSHGGALSAI